MERIRKLTGQNSKHSELHKLIRAVSKRILQQPCSDEHLREIGRCITNWQAIAPHLNLSPADEEDITAYSPEDKSIRMLKRWQEKYGSGATYRSLADSFQKSERADLIDKIRALLTAPKYHLPSSMSTLSPYGVRREQTLAAIPLRQGPQSPIATLPYSPSLPVPVPIRRLDRTHHGSTPESPIPTSDHGEDLQIFPFDDATSGMTVQSYNERSSQSTEEGACGSVSPQWHSREEEHSKTGIRLTGTSLYEEWCCHLKKHDGGSSSQEVTASAVIVQLDYPPKEFHTHLPGLRPMKKYPKEYGSVETSYILITCHRVIPGMSYLKGWSLDVGLGKSRLKSPLKLQGLVCGAVSCCGENGFISSGPLKPTKETAVFSSHLNGRCWLDLDFTVLFLNPTFEKLILNRKGVQTEPPEINLNFLEAEKHKQLQLYQRERRYKVEPISPWIGVQPQDSSLSTLKDEICVHKTLQVIHYTQSESKFTQCCSGSPLVSCDPDGAETLVGIHVKAGSDYNGSGVTIYGIFQLLKGQLAAFFALMEQAHARRKWPFRWAHLLTHTLESDVVGLKEKPLSYLLEILHLLLTDKMGICPIELRVSDSSLKHKSALEFLSAVFKQFDKYGCEEIAEAVSEMFADSEETTENQFNRELQQLSDFLVDLLHYLLKTKNEVDLVKAYFVCYNRVLNFERKGKIQAALSRDDVTEDLQCLQSMYSALDREYVIEKNFHDIQLQLMKCKYELRIHQLEAQLQQLKAQLEAQLQQLEAHLQATRQELQPYEFQIQQLKAQLQKLQDEIMEPDRRQRKLITKSVHQAQI